MSFGQNSTNIEQSNFNLFFLEEKNLTYKNTYRMIENFLTIDQSVSYPVTVNNCVITTFIFMGNYANCT